MKKFLYYVSIIPPIWDALIGAITAIYNTIHSERK